MKTDSQLQMDVSAELEWEPSVHAARIGVEVKNGVVTLAGQVDSYWEKWNAERAAQRVSGVMALATELKVLLTGPSLLVPEDRYDVMPTYFIFGGVLFAPLTRDYLKSWGHEWWKAAPNELMTTYETSIRTPVRQEVVILQKVLADEMNQGYHEYENHIVVRVDDFPFDYNVATANKPAQSRLAA